MASLWPLSVAWFHRNIASGILAGMLGLAGVFWISGIGVAIGAVILAVVFVKIPDREEAKAVV